MSKKRLMRGIKRITTFLAIVCMVVSIFNWIVMEIKYPEFHSSTQAYYTIYGNDSERLEILDEKAQKMGYEDFNDYRVRTW